MNFENKDSNYENKHKFRNTVVGFEIRDACYKIIETMITKIETILEKEKMILNFGTILKIDIILEKDEKTMTQNEMLIS